MGRRAISVPLTSSIGRTVPALLAFDMRVDRARDHLVSATRFKLVDHRSPFAVVPNTRHQVTQARSAVGRNLVACVPKVVEMQARHADGRHRLRPE